MDPPNFVQVNDYSREFCLDSVKIESQNEDNNAEMNIEFIDTMGTEEVTNIHQLEHVKIENECNPFDSHSGKTSGEKNLYIFHVLNHLLFQNQ